jgi:ATP-dependent RNA helicase RhlE
MPGAGLVRPCRGRQAEGVRFPPAAAIGYPYPFSCTVFGSHAAPDRAPVHPPERCRPSHVAGCLTTQNPDESLPSTAAEPTASDPAAVPAAAPKKRRPRRRKPAASSSTGGDAAQGAGPTTGPAGAVPTAARAGGRAGLVFEEVAVDDTPTTFEAWNLSKGIMKGLADRGFVQPTPIQRAVFDLVLDGKDVIACAQTGTGKTAAFLLPLMQHLLDHHDHPEPGTMKVLILAPTRELAHQIDEDFLGFAYHAGLSGTSIYGGVDMGPQTRALEAGVDVVVATPGRLMDHMRYGGFRFDHLAALVLDEADRMLDMGFWPDVKKIVAALPPTRQTLFFSATTSPDVMRSAAEIMREPVLVRVGGPTGLASTITHEVHLLGSHEKVDWLSTHLRRWHGTSLIFVRMKRHADQLARQLSSAGIRCAAIHADRSQDQRLDAIEAFKSGRVRVLVATDIAARGLDIDAISRVINYEPPHDVDTYVHRVGRTGRAEAGGAAVTLASHDELWAVRAIEKQLALALVDPAIETPAGSGAGRGRHPRRRRPSK